MMVKMKPAIKEERCSACGGTGVAKIKQPPIVPGRRIYPPPCEDCGGKGRITKHDGSAQ